MIKDNIQIKIDIIIKSIQLYEEYIDSQFDEKIIDNFKKKLDVELKNLQKFKDKYPELFI